MKICLNFCFGKKIIIIIIIVIVIIVDLIWKESSIDLSQPTSHTMPNQHWTLQTQAQLVAMMMMTMMMIRTMVVKRLVMMMKMPTKMMMVLTWLLMTVF